MKSEWISADTRDKRFQKDAKVHKAINQLCHGLREYPDIFPCKGLASHGSRSTSVLGVTEPSAPPNERPLAADGEEKLVKGLCESAYELLCGVIDPL